MECNTFLVSAHSAVSSNPRRIALLKPASDEKKLVSAVSRKCCHPLNLSLTNCLGSSLNSLKADASSTFSVLRFVFLKYAAAFSLLSFANILS